MIIVKCDKCGCLVEFRSIVLRDVAGSMHTVCPGNSVGNDRTLCDDCFEQYKRIESSIEKEATTKLLHWIDCGVIKIK